MSPEGGRFVIEPYSSMAESVETRMPLEEVERILDEQETGAKDG